MEAFAKFLEFLNAPIKYLIGAFVADVLFLYAPPSMVLSLGLLKYREQGKAYFGLLALILTVLIIGSIAGALIEKFNDYWFARAGQKRLKALTADEKQILSRYVEGETRTAYLDTRSGVVNGLIHERIIYRSSRINAAEYGAFMFAHNIQPWAWKYLNEHRDLLLVETFGS